MKTSFGIDPSLEFVQATIAVLTVSDTRTSDTDTSGKLLATRAEALGHKVMSRLILKDEASLIIQQLRAWVAQETIDIILITGGTGITARDVTPEAVQAVIDKEIPGFGEYFRQISMKSIGLAAMQSRALAGVSGATLIFAVPGSTGACKDAWDEIFQHQLDSRYKPCNFIELLPRLVE
jgi:molybdenum cofactor biosynthesis protein B